jgi:thiamine biosynthesis lipoprotein
MTLVARSPFSSLKNSGHGSLFLYVLIGFIVVLALVSTLSSCDVRSKRHSVVLSGPIMGTDYRISVVTEHSLDEEDLHTKVFAVMQAVNLRMSTYLKESELTRLNLSPANVNIALSTPLADVIDKSLYYSNLTNGAFDITIGPLVRLWGFGADQTVNRAPTERDVDAALPTLGFDKLLRVDRSLRKAHKNVELDLSAIAKGYAIDQVAELFDAEGLHDYLINIGGELRASGVNAGNQIWRVGIEQPDSLGAIQDIVQLHDLSIATSGDYLNFVVYDSQRYSHIMDPRSKEPSLHRLASVSVIHQYAADADALATALLVMGEVEGVRFANKHNIPAQFIIREPSGERYRGKVSGNFSDYLSK